MAASVGGYRKVVIVTALVAAGALVIAGAIGLATGSFTGGWNTAQSVNIDEHRAFAASGVDRVTLGAVSESVRIVPIQGDSFQISFTGSVRSANRDSIPTLAAELHGGALDVRIVHRPAVGFDYYSGELNLEVGVPASFAHGIAAGSVSGAVSAANLSLSAFEVKTTSGGIELDGIKSGTLAVRSVSGSVKGVGLQGGALSVDTTSGSVALSGSADALEIRTVSGGVSATTTTVPKSTEIHSTSGGVTLTLPKDAQFALDARSTSGDLQCAFPVTLTRGVGGGRHELVGTIGESENRVMVRTVSGGVSIQR